MSRAPLPIDRCIPDLRLALDAHRAAVVVAAPGAGKTTRIPPALAELGKVVVLQPRRVAARAVARRIADEQGWTLGQQVGWHVRFERSFTAETRVLLVTEGMLTNYLDEDPLLSGVSVVVLDEFHERSVHTDLGLALAAQAWRARDDLHLLVMSATLDPGPVRAFLDGCPLIEAAGRSHPLTVEYRAGRPVADAVADALTASEGDVLCFLPGAGEIERAIAEAQPAARRFGVELVPLHGSLDAEAQDRAIRQGVSRRVVFATNIAETSITVPGVTAVVDTGLQKVARYDAERAIDQLVLERVSADSADQRAGRAARLGPGRVWRLWSEHDRLRPRREPEIHRVDLAGVLLSLLAAGNRPDGFAWFEAPDAGRVGAALLLLERLGAIQEGAVTPLGHRMRRLPLHPRLARVLVAGEGAWEAAAACALLSERRQTDGRRVATTCDLLPLLDRWTEQPVHVKRVAEALERAAGGGSGRTHIDERRLRAALLAGYPDRLARRREGDPSRLLLSSGRGARAGPETGVMGGDWLVALDVTSAGGPGQEARVRAASLVETEWVAATSREVEHRFDDVTGTVKAFVTERYDAIVMSERPIAPESARRTALLAAAWLDRPLDAGAEQLVRRAAFARVELNLAALVEVAAATATRLDDIDPQSALPWSVGRAIESGAPTALSVPSGRSIRLTYNPDGSVTAAVKLQELFGLAETPRLGPAREPVIFALLAPNGRPVQTTRDLRSFWSRTYPEVRKELRGRYPRHPWPEDPWSATPTHRTVRRS